MQHMRFSQFGVHYRNRQHDGADFGFPEVGENRERWNSIGYDRSLKLFIEFAYLVLFCKLFSGTPKIQTPAVRPWSRTDPCIEFA
jgi:hypothetical protein